MALDVGMTETSNLPHKGWVTSLRKAPASKFIISWLDISNPYKI